MNIPISNFNDTRVTLEQEITEKTVAYRDLTNLEKQYIIEKHKKQYWYFKHQPLALVLLMIYEIALFYANFIYLDLWLNELFFGLVILPPFFFYTGYLKEKQYFKDISLPVVKTVGVLKTVEIQHRKGGKTRYFEVEDVRFSKDGNPGVVEHIFDLFGVNQTHNPVRIEYSPNSCLIWEIKERDTTRWETIYDVLPEKFEEEPMRLLSASDQNLASQSQ